MNNDPVITQAEIEQNRRRAVEALIHNTRGFDKIQLRLSDGCKGRCAGGLMLEALGHNLTLSDKDEESLAQHLEGEYTALEYLLGYPDPDEGMKFAEFVWNINDKDNTTFADVGHALEKLWFDGA